MISKLENWKLLINKKEEEPHKKNKYKKPKIKKSAPNWVQKNIKYAASIQRLVLANLYNIKNEGINNNS